MHHVTVLPDVPSSLHIINRHMKPNFTLGIIYMRQGQYGITQRT